MTRAIAMQPLGAAEVERPALLSRSDSLYMAGVAPFQTWHLVSGDEEEMAAVSFFEGHTDDERDVPDTEHRDDRNLSVDEEEMREMPETELETMSEAHADDEREMAETEPRDDRNLDEEEMATLSFLQAGTDEREMLGPWFQRGCKDLDAPSVDYVLTPIFQFSRDKRFLIHFGDKIVSYSSTSPAKKLELNPFSAEAVAECVFRLEASENHVKYGTAFFVSPTVVLTAAHLIFMESTLDYYTIINSIPAGDSMFQHERNTKGSLLKAKFFSTLSSLPKMTDPISKTLYSPYGDCMDVAALCLSQKTKYKGIPLKRIHNFLLPISINEAIAQYGKEGSIAVGVCGFPMFSEFLKTVRSSENADRHHIFEIYKLCFSSYWKQLSEEKISIAQKKLCFFNKMVEVLENTFMEFTTGSMACSVGRVIGYDDTTIAASYTCLAGSSGSPVFSPDIPFVGVFVGLHDAPAGKKVTSRGEVYPDYNLATSTDNLGFVIHYLQNVLPTLPPPSSFKEVDKRRLKAFCAWLWKHMNFILASKNEIMDGKDWGDEHARWFNFMLAEMDGARTLCIELTDVEVNQLIRKCKQIKKELFTMYNVCKHDEIAYTIQDFETRLEAEDTIFSLFQAIALQIRGKGLVVSAWGFPRKCLVKSVHVLQKLALALE